MRILKSEVSLGVLGFKYTGPPTGLHQFLTDKYFLNKQYQFTDSYPNIYAQTIALRGD